MVITLKYANILNDMKAKSQLEVANIADPDARYRAQVGTEKTVEIQRCISRAVNLLAHQCRRFLVNTYTESATDDISVPEQYVFEFSMSERRMVGATEPLQEEMHAFSVHYALAQFYSSVSQQELSNIHSKLTQEAQVNIMAILYHKNPPTA